MKTKFLVFFMLFAFAWHANAAEPLISKVSTSFALSQRVKCDRVNARFELFAQGDNYSMALERLSKLNNNFMNFLKTIFPKNDVKTSNVYGYGTTVSSYVSIDSERINAVGKVLNYIAGKKFPYKTGIKPVYVRFGISNKLKQRVNDELFRRSLRMVKERLNTVNSEISKGYVIGNLNVRFGSQYRIMPLSKGITTSTFTTSAGEMKINANVDLDLIKRLK